MVTVSTLETRRASDAVGIGRAGSTSFAEFDRRARGGARLTIAFFGGALTWGANASDPQETSYRALLARRFEDAYPKAHFTFRDASLSGMGSQLGVFRLERDVIRHSPDLIFLDFSATDGLQSEDSSTLAAYEAILRAITQQCGAAVVQVLLPTRADAARRITKGMKRRDAVLDLADAYGTALGDAIEPVQELLKTTEGLLAQIWPYDGIHPCDLGYRLFADAVWEGYEAGVRDAIVGRAPTEMLHAETYTSIVRARIAEIKPLPSGWTTGEPSRTSVGYDSLMSRWLDTLAIATRPTDPPGVCRVDPSPHPGPDALVVTFRGEMILLFGESTPHSGSYHASIDDRMITRRVGLNHVAEFDAAAPALKAGGVVKYEALLASGLDPIVEHTLRIEPIVLLPSSGELRLESICVAGEGSWVG